VLYCVGLCCSCVAVHTMHRPRGHRVLHHQTQTQDTHAFQTQTYRRQNHTNHHTKHTNVGTWQTIPHKPKRERKHALARAPRARERYTCTCTCTRTRTCAHTCTHTHSRTATDISKAAKDNSKPIMMTPGQTRHNTRALISFTTYPVPSYSHPTQYPPDALFS